MESLSDLSLSLRVRSDNLARPTLGVVRVENTDGFLTMIIEDKPNLQYISNADVTS